jgi:hypothetical protein
MFSLALGFSFYLLALLLLFFHIALAFISIPTYITFIFCNYYKEKRLTRINSHSWRFKRLILCELSRSPRSRVLTRSEIPQPDFNNDVMVMDTYRI